MSYQDLKTDASLLCHYMPAGGTTDSPNDVSGNGNNATWTGTPTYIDGSHGRAFDLKATTRYLTMPNFGISSNTVTYCCRVKFDSVSANDGILFRRDGVGATAHGLSLSSAGNTFAQVWTGSTYAYGQTATTGVVYNLVLSISGSQSNLLVNGTNESRTTTYFSSTWGQSRFDIGIDNVTIPGRQMIGTIEDIMIFSRTLTSDERTAYASYVPAFEYFGEGEVELSGTAQFSISFNGASTGGVEIDGTSAASLALDYQGSGSVTIGGSAPATLGAALTGSGGIQLGGTAYPSVSINTVCSGGVVLGGGSSPALSLNVQASGTITLSGSAQAGISFNFQSSGGISISGQTVADVELITVGDGVLHLSGSATYSVVLPPAISQVVNLANGIVALLNSNEDWSMPFTAKRIYLPDYDSRKRCDLQVSILPGGQVIETETRGSTIFTVEMELGIHKKVNPDNHSEIEELLGLIQEIIDFSYGKTIEGFAYHQSTMNDPIYDAPTLNRFRTFVSVITLEYKFVITEGGQ